LKVSSEVHETNLKPHQWVRIKSGPYEGDLGIVELIESNQRALVKLIPRILYTVDDDGETKIKVMFNKKDRTSNDCTIN
jgi:transcription antitermination factor NusG